MSAVLQLSTPQVSRPMPAPARQPVDEIGTVELAGNRIRYSRNEEIFGEGDPASSVYRVLSGTVRIYRLLSDGRRQIERFCFAGDTFGLESGPEHRKSAEAVTESELVVTPRQSFVRHAAQNAEFAYQLWTRTAADLAGTCDHLLMLGRQSAAERVAAFLLEMAEREGSSELVTLPMSRQDIADYLGLTIETVSRTLTHLEEQGILDVTTARRIALRDVRALRRLNS